MASTTLHGDDGRRTPWHLWLVGGLTLIWNCGGIYDYLMSVTRNPAYMAQMTPEQVAFLTSAPVWSMAAYAIGVWGALAGSILLLLKRRWAFHAFVVSLAAFLINAVNSFVLSDGFAIMGTVGAIFSAAIFAIMLFEIWYSRMMTKRGVLR